MSMTMDEFGGQRPTDTRSLLLQVEGILDRIGFSNGSSVDDLRHFQQAYNLTELLLLVLDSNANNEDICRFLRAEVMTPLHKLFSEASFVNEARSKARDISSSVGRISARIPYLKIGATVGASLDGMTDTDRLIAECIRSKPGIRGDELANTLNIAKRTVQLYLGKNSTLWSLGYRQRPKSKGYYPPPG